MLKLKNNICFKQTFVHKKYKTTNSMFILKRPKSNQYLTSKNNCISYKSHKLVFFQNYEGFVISKCFYLYYNDLEVRANYEH